MKNSQKGSVVVVILIIIIVVLVAVVGYMYFSKPVATSQVSNDSQTVSTQNITSTSSVSNETTANNSTSNQVTDGKTYTNAQYGFSFQYPPSYQAQNPASDLVMRPNEDSVVELHGSPDDILVTHFSGPTLGESSSAESGTATLYFDATKNQWMQTVAGVSAKDDSKYKETAPVTPSYGSSGSPYFSADTGVSSSVIIPLSHSSFVIIGIGDWSLEDDNILNNIASTFKLTN